MSDKHKDNINKPQQRKPEKGKLPENNGNFFKGKGNKNTVFIFIAIAIGFFILQYASNQETAVKISQLRFETKMLTKPQAIERINIVNNKKVEIFINETYIGDSEFSDRPASGGQGIFTAQKSPDYYFMIGSVEVFINGINKFKNKDSSFNFPIEYEERTDIFGELMGWLFPLLIIVVIWIFIFRRMGGGMGGGGGGIFNVGKSKAKLFDNEKTKIKVNFTNVAGLEEAKIEVQEIVDFLKKPDKYTKLGGKIPKGALLVGPPGTGKTLLAKAVAGEANVPFFSLSGSDFVEMFVGVGASRVRDLFAQAKQKSPCIVFIDEIDAIGRARGRGLNMGGNDERENTLNQLLTEMDGFDTNTGVIIIAATNRADILDPALMRAGRFDRQIHVDLPDLTEREDIFKVHLKPIKCGKDVDVEKLSRQTPGFSGADIANVCNEAALIAARTNKEEVAHQDFHDAIDRIIGGLEKKSKIITPTEKKTIAYHEAGHATVSWMLEYAHPLVKITIVPRGQALGAAWYQPHERQITTKEQLLDEMCSTLGGRASEELTFSKISSGALNDLERVTKQAYSMTAFLGMSEKIGNISFYDSSGRGEYQFQKPYSEITAELIDQEVKKMIEEQYQKAKKILSDNKEKMNELAELLLENEVIYYEDVENIFGKREFADEYEEEIQKVRKRNIERLKKQKEDAKKEKEEEKREEEKKKKKL
ncbi:MAG: ATP-dependent zinc metalloprotease FtsH [Bacteroidales bacterium]|nr:ATP-dependent zinc metalloprotease FtsH [Bacteroidales bacterium]